jgi:3-oxoacyl-[acyl-carrier protein] reductase
MAVLFEAQQLQRSILMTRLEKAEKTAQAINSDGGAAIAVPGDITKNEDISSLVQKAAEFGGGKIHIIVNNAGYAWDSSIEKIQDKQWGECRP